MKNIIVYNYIRDYRKARDWTQTELAIICGTTKNNISCIENGFYQPSLSLALLLSLVFECELVDLFELDYDYLLQVNERKGYIYNENQSNRN